MANTLSETLNNLKGLAGEMAPDLFELIQSINITCKADGKFVYVIIEIEELFFLDCAKFFNELTCILNPEAQIIFSFLVESAFLKKILH